MSSEDLRDPLDLPTEQLREDAFKLFGETKELRAEKIEEVRVALNSMDCGEFDKSDANIVRYLRGKKFNVEKALKCISNRINFTKEHPEWTTNLNAKEFETFFSFMTILPQRDKENRVLLLVRPGLFIRQCTKEFIRDYPYAMIRFNLWMNEALSTHPQINVYGAVFILSALELTVWDAATFSAVAKVDERAAFFKYLFSCTPMRVGGMYMFHEPFYVRWLYNLVSVFLSAKIKGRMHIGSKNYSILEEVVSDISALPTCLGGKEEIDSGAFENDWMHKLFFPNQSSTEEEIHSNTEVNGNEDSNEIREIEVSNSDTVE